MNCHLQFVSDLNKKGEKTMEEQNQVEKTTEVEIADEKEKRQMPDWLLFINGQLQIFDTKSELRTAIESLKPDDDFKIIYGREIDYHKTTIVKVDF